MTRKLLIVVFVLSVACNSLAGALPYIAGDAECEGNCCRVVRRSESRANQSRMRCLMQCERPADKQGLPESPLLRTERDTKVVSPVAPGIQAVCPTLNSRTLHPTSRIAPASIHIYLKTGTLLI